MHGALELSSCFPLLIVDPYYFHIGDEEILQRFVLSIEDANQMLIGDQILRKSNSG